MAGETLPAGSTNTQGLADWASPYITNYLGKAQALADTPYQVYGGPLTAGASTLQNKVFDGLAGLTFPTNLGQSFSSAGAPTIGANGQPSGGGGIAQSYMNPYLQSVLDPQLEELRRQNAITNMNTNAKLTQAGGYGGGRQAIMNAENNRNLMMEQNKTVGQGYANAYDKAMGQFNTEQGQSRDLVNMLAAQGGVERAIEAEGIAADLAEFEKQRQYPFQQVQYLRDMISGLPTGAVKNEPGQLSGVGTLLSALGGGAAAAKAFGYKDVGELLKGLGLTTGE
jgi:hypothetical protein